MFDKNFKDQLIEEITDPFFLQNETIAFRHQFQL